MDANLFLAILITAVIAMCAITVLFWFLKGQDVLKRLIDQSVIAEIESRGLEHSDVIRNLVTQSVRHHIDEQRKWVKDQIRSADPDAMVRIQERKIDALLDMHQSLYDCHRKVHAIVHDARLWLYSPSESVATEIINTLDAWTDHYRRNQMCVPIKVADCLHAYEQAIDNLRACVCNRSNSRSHQTLKDAISTVDAQYQYAATTLHAMIRMEMALA